MFRQIIILAVLGGLCGCAGLSNVLTPYKNMDNYTKNIENLDKTVMGRLVHIPDICASLGEHFADSENTIQEIASLKISTKRSSKEAYDLWKQLSHCAKLYENASSASEQIGVDIRSYFDKRYDNLSYSSWRQESSSAREKRKNDFVIYYVNRLAAKYPKQFKELEQALQYHKSLTGAEQKTWEHFYNLDRAVFLKRTKGKDWCQQEVCSFISEYTYGAPSKKCIYPNNGIYLMASGAHSSNASGTLFGGLSGELRWDLKMYNLIFVFKNKFNDPPYVSGEQLRGNYYVYTGVYTYHTVMGGMNSVYSFKEFELKNADKDLYFYGKERKQ